GVSLPAVTIQPGVGNAPDLAALTPRHRFKRTAEMRSQSRFHFNEGNQSIAPCDHVDFYMSHAESMRQDVPTFALQMRDRDRFTLGAEALAVVFPFCRIGSQRHGQQYRAHGASDNQKCASPWHKTRITPG